MVNAVSDVLTVSAAIAESGANPVTTQQVADNSTGLSNANTDPDLISQSAQYAPEKQKVASLQFEPEMSVKSDGIGDSIMHRLDIIANEEKQRRAATSKQDMESGVSATEVTTVMPGPAAAPMPGSPASPGSAMKAEWFETQFGQLERSFVYATEISMVTKIASNLSGNVQGLLTRN
ncbi:MAG: hypothetical protein AAGE61_18215 [Pseudomonadota bacterium]